MGEGVRAAASLLRVPGDGRFRRPGVLAFDDARQGPDQGGHDNSRRQRQPDRQAAAHGDCDDGQELHRRAGWPCFGAGGDASAVSGRRAKHRKDELTLRAVRERMARACRRSSRVPGRSPTGSTAKALPPGACRAGALFGCLEGDGGKSVVLVRRGAAVARARPAGRRRHRYRRAAWPPRHPFLRDLVRALHRGDGLARRPGGTARRRGSHPCHRCR